MSRAAPMSAATRARRKEGARSARKGLHRALVLEAAERVFAERGYDGTRMQDIASEAGLALATLYAAIPSKEDIFAAIHETRGRALLERAARASAGASSAFEALLAGVDSYVEFLADHPAYLRIHLLESQPWALDPRFTTAEQRRQWREGLELTALVFREGIEQRAFLPGDPELYARVMIAGHQVFLARWVESGMKEAPRALADRMKDFVRRSFGA